LAERASIPAVAAACFRPRSSQEHALSCARSIFAIIDPLAIDQANKKLAEASLFESLKDNFQ